jgi:hypothetical protein
MTVIGKILTFLIFFLSLVFLGFAYNINLLNKDPKSKQSWYEVAQFHQKQHAELQNDYQAKVKELERLAGANKTLEKQIADNKATAKAELDKVSSERDQANTRALKAVAEKEEFSKTVEAANVELEKRRAENTALYNQLKGRDLTITEQNAKVTQAENLRDQARVEADTYRNRLASVESDLRSTTQALERTLENKTLTSAAGAEGAIIGTPPPEDVKGRVKAVDAANGLVHISIGSDAGLLKGHTLQVFRTEPKAQYLGQIRIVEVGPQEAVGKIVSPQYKKLVQKDDIVASRIVER